MRAAYTPCKIYVDGIPQLAVGEYLRTPGGSGYLVHAIRPSQKRPWRRNLQCLRWPVDEIPADAKVYELHWYARRRKPARTLASFKTEPQPQDELE